MTTESDATRLLPGPPAIAKITTLRSRSATLAHEDFVGSIIHELEVEPAMFPSGRQAAQPVMDG